ncbi:MFS transporter [Alteribacillus bidgolensis]|nr:MFS transporter [Alteribacillus bidgolensis]
MKLVLIMIISCFNVLSLMGTRPTVSLFAYDLGASATHIGLITSLFSFFPLLFAIRLGKKIDYLHSKLALIIGGYLGVAGIALPGIFPNIYSLYASQIIAGSAQTIFILAAQDYVGRISSNKNRSKNVSWFSLGVGVGMFLGPLTSGFAADLTNYQMAFLMLAGVGLIGSIIISFIPDEPPIERDKNANGIENSSNSFMKLLHIPSLRLALIFSALVLFSRDLYMTFFPLLGVQFEYSDSVIGTFIAINGLAGVIIRFYLSRLITILGSTKLLTVTMLLMIVALVGLPFSPSLVVTGILVFFLGVGLGIGAPLSITLTLESTIQGRSAETLGLRLTVNRMTQVATPLLLGAVASAMGLVSMFIISACTISLGLGAAFKASKDPNGSGDNNEEVNDN